MRLNLDFKTRIILIHLTLLYSRNQMKSNLSQKRNLTEVWNHFVTFQFPTDKTNHRVYLYVHIRVAQIGK